jgi:hypothetical protein
MKCRSVVHKCIIRCGRGMNKRKTVKIQIQINKKRWREKQEKQSEKRSFSFRNGDGRPLPFARGVKLRLRQVIVTNYESMRNRMAVIKAPPTAANTPPSVMVFANERKKTHIAAKRRHRGHI